VITRVNLKIISGRCVYLVEQRNKEEEDTENSLQINDLGHSLLVPYAGTLGYNGNRILSSATTSSCCLIIIRNYHEKMWQQKSERRKSPPKRADWLTRDNLFCDDDLKVIGDTYPCPFQCLGVGVKCFDDYAKNCIGASNCDFHDIPLMR
jgi:hypothetical protein